MAIFNNLGKKQFNTTDVFMTLFSFSNAKPIQATEPKIADNMLQ